jgi:hypothetical protein
MDWRQKMNHAQNFVLVMITATLITSFIVSASADTPVHAIPGLAGFSTITMMDARGIATTGTAISLQVGSPHALNAPPLENGGYLWTWDPVGPSGPYIDGYTVDPWVADIYGTPIPLGEVQYTAEYNEGVTAVSGSVRYQKTMRINTANKTIGEDNIAADRRVTFIGGNGGRMTTSEDILLDGLGAQTISASKVLCPFENAANPFYPPFCNIVISGSSADISTGSVSTSVGARFIAASADVPAGETYLINAKGVTESGDYSDISGTVSAYTKAHIQEGIEQQVPRRFVTDPLGFNPVKAEDLSYYEVSTASGSIHSFTKDIQYQSGICLF